GADIESRSELPGLQHGLQHQVDEEQRTGEGEIGDLGRQGWQKRTTHPARRRWRPWKVGTGASAGSSPRRGSAATRYVEYRTRRKAGYIGKQEQHGLRHLLGLSRPLHRDQRSDPCCPVRLAARGMDFRAYRSRANAIDPNALACHLASQAARETI